MAHHRRQRLADRFLAPIVLVPTVLAAATGVAVAWGLTAGQVAGGEPTVDPFRFATSAPTATPVDPRPAWSAWPGVSAAPTPDAAALSARLLAIPRVGAGTVGLAVVDPASGRLLVDDGAESLIVPASTLKLFVSAAALKTLGADHRFTTTVVSVPDGIVLVGGGDPVLADAKPTDYPQRASLEELADATAAALSGAGRTQVTLGFDAGLFAGPDWNDQWEDGDQDFVTPTSALWMDRGITDAGRTQTPALDAARRFAALLGARGITVTGAPAAATAPADAATVAQVSSPDLSVIVEECLRTSDNDVAEVLFRHLGRIAGDGSITASQQALPGILTDLGVWGPGMVTVDGSGLSYSDRVTPAAIAKTVALGVTDTAFRALTEGLPVAGGYGTLGMPWRYADPEEQVARGAVRAKTGSLTGVNTLGGYVLGQSGVLYVFGLTSNDGDTPSAQDWLDHVTAALAES